MTVNTEIRPGTVFPENASDNLEPADGACQRVPLARIDPNPYQARLLLDPAQMSELARSLRQKRTRLPATQGLLQVPLGRLTPAGRIQLAFGHRRRAAFQYNFERFGPDWAWLPVRIVVLSDEEMYRYAASENADRLEPNPIEKAHAIRVGLQAFNWSYRQAGAAHGLSKSAAANLVRLLELPPVVQQWVAVGRLGQRHARELVRLMQAEPPLREACLTLARSTVDNGLTVAATQATVDHYLRSQAHPKRPAVEAATGPPCWPGWPGSFGTALALSGRTRSWRPSSRREI